MSVSVRRKLYKNLSDARALRTGLGEDGVYLSPRWLRLHNSCGLLGWCDGRCLESERRMEKVSLQRLKGARRGGCVMIHEAAQKNVTLIFSWRC